MLIKKKPVIHMAGDSIVQITDLTKFSEKIFLFIVNADFPQVSHCENWSIHIHSNGTYIVYLSFQKLAFDIVWQVKPIFPYTV